MKEDFERRQGKEPRNTTPPPPPPSPDGEISKSMGIDTKPAYKLEIQGYWVLVDPNAPKKFIEDLKMAIAIHL